MKEKKKPEITGKEATRIAYTEGWLSVLVNSLLFILKFSVGILIGSVAIMADAWHTLSDSMTSIVVIIGTKISSKPADREHPFGHGRAEILSSVIIGVLLGMVGVNFISEAAAKIGSHERTEFGILAIVVTIISVVVKELLAQFAFAGARKTGLSSLKSDAWHHRSDAISSLVILAGIFLGRYFWWIDAVLGFIVAGLLIYTAWEIVSDAVKPLMGEAPSDEFIDELNTIVHEAAPQSGGLHHVHLHNYGGHAELTFHLRFSPSMTLQESHSLATAAEKAIREKLSMESTIHIEPSTKN